MSKQPMTPRQAEIWNELRARYGDAPFWNTEPYSERNARDNGNRRVMGALKRAGYIVELPNHQWQLVLGEQQ